MNDHQHLDLWLRRLSWALGRMPSEENADIVREARSHVEERIAQGEAVASVLAQFGEPERYASQFVEEMEACEALGSQRVADLTRVVAGRAPRNLTAAASLALTLFATAVAGMTFILALLKLVDPAHVGLWKGPGFLFLGVIDDPTEGSDLLGYGFVPLACIALLATWVAIQRLLATTVRRLQSGATNLERGEASR